MWKFTMNSKRKTKLLRRSRKLKGFWTYRWGEGERRERGFYEEVEIEGFKIY